MEPGLPQKEDCKAGRIYYAFSDIKESLRFVGAYQYPGYDPTDAYRGEISVYNTQVANVFGWGKLHLDNSVTCDGSVSNFGHMQYDSSFYHYWTEQKKQDANGGDRYVPKNYAPNLSECIGYVYMKNSTICSGGDCYDGWNRQRFNSIELRDNNNKFEVYNATKTNSTNVVDMSSLTPTTGRSYRATISMEGRFAPTKENDAYAMLRVENTQLVNATRCIETLKTHANVTCFMTTASEYTAGKSYGLIKLFTDVSQQGIYLYSGTSNTGTAIYETDSFADALNHLRKQTGTYYTLSFATGYTLVQKDVDAFNNATGFIDKNVIIMSDGAIAGSDERTSPSTGLRLWDQVFPKFNSLTWKNVKFRSDFHAFNEYSFVMHGNGHNLTFENCTFTGNSTINAGGNSTQEHQALHLH